MIKPLQGFPGGSDGEECPARQETQVRSLAWEDSLDFDSLIFCSPLPIFTCLGGSNENNSTYNSFESVKPLVIMSCLPLLDLMDCSPPGVPVHGILQARVLE